MELKISKEWLLKWASPWHKTPEDDLPAFSFNVDVGQSRQLGEWMHEHNKTCPFRATEENPFPAGAIGGSLTYSFCNTNLGQVCKVECACGGSVDLTEYGDW